MKTNYHLIALLLLVFVSNYSTGQTVFTSNNGQSVTVYENTSNLTITVEEIEVMGEYFRPVLNRSMQNYQGEMKFIYVKTIKIGPTAVLQFSLSPNREVDGQLKSFVLSWYLFPDGQQKMFSDYASSNFRRN